MAARDASHNCWEPDESTAIPVVGDDVSQAELCYTRLPVRSGPPRVSSSAQSSVYT